MCCITLPLWHSQRGRKSQHLSLSLHLFLQLFSHTHTVRTHTLDRHLTNEDMCSIICLKGHKLGRNSARHCSTSLQALGDERRGNGVNKQRSFPVCEPDETACRSVYLWYSVYTISNEEKKTFSIVQVLQMAKVTFRNVRSLQVEEAKHTKFVAIK